MLKKIANLTNAHLFYFAKGRKNKWSKNLNLILNTEKFVHSKTWYIHTFVKLHTKSAYLFFPTSMKWLIMAKDTPLHLAEKRPQSSVVWEKFVEKIRGKNSWNKLGKTLMNSLMAFCLSNKVRFISIQDWYTHLQKSW